MKSSKNSSLPGKANGRRIAVQGTPDIHRAQQYPIEHPGTSQVPFLVNPISITNRDNLIIRRVWRSSHYYGKDFSPFEISDVPSKYRFAQVLACGLKATNATYSQHWEGMYFDWSFNSEISEIVSSFKKMSNDERFVDNAFATVVLMNTGYRGPFMEMLKLRRKPIPPSMMSLEQVDMGTFEHNLKAAIGSVLGGDIGANIIKHSLSGNLINGENRAAYDKLKKALILQGMDKNARIASIMQIGFKQPEDRIKFKKKTMDMAGAKIIERKSERRNVDFSKQIHPRIMLNFFTSFVHELKKNNIHDAVKTIVVKGNSQEGRSKLNRIRDRIDQGLNRTLDDLLASFDENKKDGITSASREDYNNMSNMVVDMGKKVLKPREDGHNMVFIYIDMEKLSEMEIPVDMAEQAVGEGIQAVLNSIHLDGTTTIPEGDDLRYGAFCLTGPLHSAECNDSTEELLRGWGHGFWDILDPELPETNKMVAVIAISAKNETDAMIAEIQAMEQRKSVNDIFWYKTWNHPEGKNLDVPQWISYSDILNTVPIAGNDIPLKDKKIPEHLPEGHVVSKIFQKRKKKQA